MTSLNSCVICDTRNGDHVATGVTSNNSRNTKIRNSDGVSTTFAADDGCNTLSGHRDDISCAAINGVVTIDEAAAVSNCSESDCIGTGATQDACAGLRCDRTADDVVASTQTDRICSLEINRASQIDGVVTSAASDS